MIKTQHPASIARDRRAAIATAVSEWMHEDWTDESDLALEAALIETNVTTEEDEITGLELDEDLQGLTVLINGTTAIHIDIHGNIMKGNV